MQTKTIGKRALTFGLYSRGRPRNFNNFGQSHSACAATVSKCYQVLSLRTEQRAKLWVGRQQTCATESTQSHLVQLLPLHHLLPAPLVDGIMNSDDIRHVFLLGLQQHTRGQLFYGRDTGTENNKAFYNSRHSFRSTCESHIG